MLSPKELRDLTRRGGLVEGCVLETDRERLEAVCKRVAPRTPHRRSNRRAERKTPAARRSTGAGARKGLIGAQLLSRFYLPHQGGTVIVPSPVGLHLLRPPCR